MNSVHGSALRMLTRSGVSFQSLSSACSVAHSTASSGVGRIDDYSVVGSHPPYKGDRQGQVKITVPVNEASVLRL